MQLVPIVPLQRRLVFSCATVKMLKLNLNLKIRRIQLEVRDMANMILQGPVLQPFDPVNFDLMIIESFTKLRLPV